MAYDLDNIWIRGMKLFANLPRLGREKNKGSRGVEKTAMEKSEEGNDGRKYGRRTYAEVTRHRYTKKVGKQKSKSKEKEDEQMWKGPVIKLKEEHRE